MLNSFHFRLVLRTLPRVRSFSRTVINRKIYVDLDLSLVEELYSKQGKGSYLTGS